MSKELRVDLSTADSAAAVYSVIKISTTDRGRLLRSL